MSSELYMECEEEELEPWQREVTEDEDEEEMDVVCVVKQEREFANCPGLDLSTPSPPPTHPPMAPQIASRLAHGISSSYSQELSLIGPSVTQGTSVICSNLAPHISVIGPNVPLVPSNTGSQIFQARSTIGSNLNLANIMMGSNITARTPVTGPQFSLTTSLIGTNCAPATSAIGTKVSAGMSAVNNSFSQGQPLILTQGPGGTFILSTGKISTAPGQIPGSPPNRPFLFTTQSLMPIQNTAINMPKLLLNVQGGQTLQPITIIPPQPTMQAVIARKKGYSTVQTKAPKVPCLLPRSTLTSNPEPSITTAPTSQPAPASIGMTTTAQPSPYTSGAVPAPTALTTSTTTTTTARLLPGAPVRFIQKIVIPKKRIVPPAEREAVAPTPRPRVAMTVGEFYYGQCFREQLPPRQVFTVLTSYQCKKCAFSTRNNIDMMKHYWKHTDIALCMQQEEDMRCNDCYRRFSSPDLLETHKQHAHRSSPPSTTVCRICEWFFSDEMEFLNHMKTNHKPGELPYVCQVCKYRSSFYSDVLQHFTRYHTGTPFLLCILCMKVTNNIQHFQQHMNKHKLKESHPCVKCRLQFTNLNDLLEHKLHHHRTFSVSPKLRSLRPGTKVTIKTMGSSSKSLPLLSRFNHSSRLFKPASTPPEQPIESDPPDPTSPGSASTDPLLSENQSIEGECRLLCMECGTKASDLSSHYPTSVSCLLCRYTTFCSCAYASHMIRNHSLSREKNKALPLHQQPPPCCFELACTECGFVSVTGDRMAQHLVLNPGHASSFCRLRTALREPDLVFSLQGGAQQDPLAAIIPLDPSKLSWVPVTSGEPRAVRDRNIQRFLHNGGSRPPALPKDGDAMDYFLLAYPESLLELIVEETNTHVKRCQYLGVPPPHWTPLGVPELKAFLGLVILMGVQALPDASQYWSTNHPDGVSFDQAMSLPRFRQIAANVRTGSLLTDEHHGGGDPLRVLKPMLDILGRAMWEVRQPNCNLSVDRTLLPALGGRAGRPVPASRQALPEIWLLCDSKTGYCHRLQIQGGRTEEGAAVGLRVIPRLTVGLDGKSHQLYLANTLASPQLMSWLLSKGIYASSSFPRHSPVLPEQLWRVGGDLHVPGHHLQWQCGPLLATRWRDAKEMGCLCTNANPGLEDTVWRRSQTQAGKLDPMQRPKAFRLLQENMRGVDICKQLLACNPLGGVPQDRHWRSLFWLLLNLSVVNSFILLRESRRDNPPSWVHGGLFLQAAFRRRLGTQLAQCHCRDPATTPNQDPVSRQKKQKQKQKEEVVVATALPKPSDPLNERHWISKITLHHKRCRYCKALQIRRESVYGCATCKVNLCNLRSCFWEFHGLGSFAEVNPRVGFTIRKKSGDIEVDGNVVKGVRAENCTQRPGRPRYPHKKKKVVVVVEEEEGVGVEVVMEYDKKEEEQERAAHPLRYTYRPEEEDEEFLVGEDGDHSESQPAGAALVASAAPAVLAAATEAAAAATDAAAAARVASSRPTGGTREPAGGAREPAGPLDARAPGGRSAWKLRVCLVALCGGLQQAASEFSVDEAQVGTWVRESRERIALVGSGGSGPMPGEDNMVEWVWSMREQQFPITETSLFQHAAMLQRRGVFGQAFRISYNWAVGLMLRHRLGLPCAGEAPAPHPPLPPLMEDGIRSFTEFTRTQAKFHQIALSAVASVARLSFFLDPESARTGSAEAPWRAQDLRLSGTGTPLMTAYMTALADGTLLPTLVLLRDPSRPGGPLEEGGPLSAAPAVLVETHREGFSSEKDLEVWVRRVWRSHASPSSLGQRKRLLVLDRHRNHVAEPFLAALGQTRTLPMLIPSGCSFRLQPLSVVALPVLQPLLLARWKALTTRHSLGFAGGADGVQRALIGWLKDALLVLHERPSLLRASFRLTGLVPEEGEGDGEEPLDRSQLIRSLADGMLGPGVLEPENPAKVETVPMEIEKQESKGATERGGGGGRRSQ